MSAEFRLLFWCSALALLVCYAWWSRFRVWVLRQDLFAIRDVVWDAMRAQGMLEDPAHREFREGINAMIRFAPDLTFFTVWRILVTNLTPSSTEETTATAEILWGRRMTFVRLVRYLLFESIVGLIVVALALVFRMFALTRDWFTRKIQSIFDSSELREISRSGYGRWAASGF